MGTAILAVSIVAAISVVSLILSFLIIVGNFFESLGATLWGGGDIGAPFAEGIFVLSLIGTVLSIPTLVILSIINAV